MGAQTSYRRSSSAICARDRPSSPRGASTVVAAAPFAPSPSSSRKRRDEGDDSLGPTLEGARWAYSSARKGAAESPLRAQAFTFPSPAEASLADAPSKMRMSAATPSTPSTATPASLSRSASDGFGLGFAAPLSRPTSSCSSRPFEPPGQGGSPSAPVDGEATDPLGGQEATARLSEARQRANNSLEALQMNLKGFGGAVAVRYMSWPVGCFVQISGDAGEGGGFGADDVRPLRTFGRFERYDAATNSCEVRLEDGSTRSVPAQRVVRVSRNRATGVKVKRRTIDASLGETESLSSACSSEYSLPSRRTAKSEPLPLVWEAAERKSWLPEHSPSTRQVERAVPVKSAPVKAPSTPVEKFHGPPAPAPKTFGKAAFDVDMLV
eukprot:TRINITY_DN100608_c0_g1_i1.p1 TRINITY_DN100608_c0_g1~~TRINITY_DN100608_c0_g1_i1.p1  ORF type:complete len:381 (+),score=55.63 TRINITY_DN100608_c0_g1_i1:120-1262(+)